MPGPGVAQAARPAGRAAARARDRGQEALALAQRLVEDQPFHERGRWLLVLALHRAGRSVEALERYRSYARRLDEELGLRPGRELQELHAADSPRSSGASRPVRRAARAGWS